MGSEELDVEKSPTGTTGTDDTLFPIPSDDEPSDHSNTGVEPTRLQSWIQWWKKPRSTETPEIGSLRVRSLDKFAWGYPNLATFKSSDEVFALYRRFGYLQSRLLLEKQDVLRVLEERLEVYDEDDRAESNTRVLDLEDGQPNAREQLLNEIENAFNSYATLLTSSQQLMAANRPSASEYRSVCRYIKQNKPLVAEELEYIQHKEDLVTLRPGRDHAWLDRSIERVLRVQPFSFLNRLFCSPETQLKSRNGTEIYFTRERIDLCASFIITAMIIALLIVPIYLLYNLVKDKEGILDAHSTGVCIGILLVSTLLFSAVLSLFTRAKRHEILGAAAAYCAVLVVFLGNVPN